MKKHLTIAVTGKVQGVFFRLNTQHKAKELGLNGTVQNQEDGSVFIKVEGEEQQLDILCNWLRQGPQTARVEEVRIDTQELEGFSDFIILK